MKTKIVVICILFIYSISNAQVGIGTTTPNALLDLKVTNASSPTTTDGLLIPRVTAFPSPVSAAQNGMLVFLTTTFSTNKVGFYYYDFPSLTWKWLASGNNLSPWVNNSLNSRIDIPFQSDGVTPRPIGNEAVILDNGNVGFGTLNPLRNYQFSKNINAGNKFAVDNYNTGNQAFTQITAETKGNAAYLYSINDTYPFNVTEPWFTPANSLLQSTGGGGLSLAATEPSAFMNFFTGGRDESMRITANGNVGIGIKNPLRTLEVAQSVRITSSNPFLELNGTFAPIPSLASMRIRSAGEIVLRSNENNASIPDWEVKYGSGTNANPNDVFYVGRRANASVLAIDNYFLINNNGNVGINTITPSEKLDITGNLKFSGAIMPNNNAGNTGQVLVSSGTGIAPIWESNPVKPFVTTSGLSGIYNVLLSHYTVRVFGGITNVVLPTPVGNLGKTFILIGSNGSGSHSLTTVAGIIYDDFGPGGFVSTINQGERVTVQSDGVNWIVIGR